MGVGEGALERALSPSSASGHLGNSRFKPDLHCADHPWELVSPSPEAKRKPRGPRGVLNSTPGCRGLMLGPRGITPYVGRPT